ncbi:predicted protein [Uncinocarpus reesii 1704]|uniref:Uncharacterized protein n=1 Tax=Uncinocarpus reesii (strain UAMH 1704) TaxID=336963 RepID=C4JZR8_UNCRE|nr:uncharacterized protein UREG_07669 [Uncinocarpus reesii 1704]EEP82804.1 predicted protein [Uncinocarpus reesii 1704]
MTKRCLLAYSAFQWPVLRPTCFPYPADQCSSRRKRPQSGATQGIRNFSSHGFREVEEKTDTEANFTSTLPPQKLSSSLSPSTGISLEKGAASDTPKQPTTASNTSSPNHTPDTHEHEPLPPRETTVVQSPVLLRRAARAKLHEKLPRKTDFDPLRRNPWAQILASPLRMCSATNARLPAKLLGDFSLVEHPQTGHPWMMPVDLLKDEIWQMRMQAEENNDADGGCKEGKTQNGQSDGVQTAATPVRRRRLPPLPKIRLVNNSAVLSRIVDMQNIQATRYLLPYRWKHPHGRLTKKESENIVWRKDLPQYVLTHMRKNVVRGIKHCCVAGKDHRWNAMDLDPKSTVVDGLKSALQSFGDLANIKCGAVLLLKRFPETENGGSPSIPERVRIPPLGTEIPVFFLPKLLTVENLQELREHHEFFTRDALLFRPAGDKTIYTIQGLWKLQSYMTNGLYEQTSQW